MTFEKITRKSQSLKASRLYGSFNPRCHILAVPSSLYIAIRLLDISCRLVFTAAALLA